MMRLILAVLLVLADSPALADSNLPPAPYADKHLADPAKETEARKLMETLRCLVCQGQSIADSDAEMAGDMRALVRQRIEAGETPGQVRDWLIQRYGDYVSYDPPVNEVTAPLWLAPLLLLMVGAFIASRSFKRRKR
jgi:cytochrome c-type biogenesis protein CcmH